MRQRAKRSEMTARYRRAGGLAVLVIAVAIGLAACGGTGPGPHLSRTSRRPPMPPTAGRPRPPCRRTTRPSRSSSGPTACADTATRTSPTRPSTPMGGSTSLSRTAPSRSPTPSTTAPLPATSTSPPPPPPCGPGRRTWLLRTRPRWSSSPTACGRTASRTTPIRAGGAQRTSTAPASTRTARSSSGPTTCAARNPRAVVVGQRGGPAGQHLGAKRPDVRGLGVPSA